MTDWMVDTLIWTAALIAVVLVLRRPVARWFGPHAAYALWAIPALRLVLPPLELPAWLNPAPVAPRASEVFFIEFSDSGAPAAATTGAETAAPISVMPITPLPWLELGLAAWLVGAVIFLALRFSAYFRLRKELLENACEVGRSDRIRLIETPGTNAPLAFGVIDPVIALPEGFMAQPDRTARDLAIEHELSHHRANDLLVNVLVQPLFALHWFTPLAHYGWMALRRDQEAACDARVVAANPADARAVYATLIASTAAGPNVALAAPMACPVLGDKSIVHRLRSLKMTDISPRRRVAGYAVLGAAVLALPLTASITYAEAPAPEVAPIAAAPLAPNAPAAPLPPAPPVPPAPPAPLAAQGIASIDPDVDVDVETDVKVEKIIKKDGETIVIHVDQDGDAEGKTKHKHVIKNRHVIINNEGEKLSEADMEAIMDDLRDSLDEVDGVLAETDVIVKEALASVGQHSTVVKMECRNDTDEVSTVIENDGGRTVLICQSRIMAQALSGLKDARDAIADNPEMPAKMRKNVLKTIDEQIARWAEAEG